MKKTLLIATGIAALALASGASAASIGVGSVSSNSGAIAASATGSEVINGNGLVLNGAAAQANNSSGAQATVDPAHHSITTTTAAVTSGDSNTVTANLQLGAGHGAALAGSAQIGTATAHAGGLVIGSHN